MDSRIVGMLVIAGGVLVVLVGILIWSGGMGWFGRLPGDLRFEVGRGRVFFPLVSMILISIVLSVLLNLFRRW